MAELKKHIYDENNGLYYTLVGDYYIPDLKLSGDENSMNDLLFCEFNIDTGCVELRYADGRRISIDCTTVENEVANNVYQRSELDWLIYNAPLEYANLILNGDLETYLKVVTICRPFES